MPGRLAVTCLGGRGVLPTSACSADAGEARPADGGVVDGPRAFRPASKSPPVLARRLGWSSAARRRIRLRWVRWKLQQVGRGVPWSQGRMEGTDGLLEVRGADLRGRTAILEAVCGVCRWSGFWTELGRSVCGGVLCRWWERGLKVGGFWKVVVRRVSGRSLGGCGGLKCGEFQKGFEMGSG